MKYYITNIRMWDEKGGIYARLVDEKGNTIIGATLEFIFQDIIRNEREIENVSIVEIEPDKVINHKSFIELNPGMENADTK